MLNIGKIIGFLLLVLHCSPVHSQSYAQSDSPLTITPSGYYLTVIDSSGIPQYTKIETIIDLTGAQQPGPDEPDEPDVPDEPSVDMELVSKIKACAKEVDDPKSAQAIAAVYAHIRGALADGTLTVQTANAALKQATDSALAVINSGKDWTSFRDKLTAEFTERKQRGLLGTSKQVVVALQSVQHGVELAADGSAAISMDNIIEIARRTNLAIDEATK